MGNQSHSIWSSIEFYMNNKLSLLLLMVLSFQFPAKAEQKPAFQEKWGLDFPNLEMERAAAEAREKADKELARQKYEFRLRVLQSQAATAQKILNIFEADYSFKYFPMDKYLKTRQESIDYHNSSMTNSQRDLVNLRPPNPSSTGGAGFVKTLNFPSQISYGRVRYLYDSSDLYSFREVNGQNIVFASYFNERGQELKLANLRDSMSQDPDILENVKALLNEEKKLLSYEKMGFLLEEFRLDEAKEVLISRNLKTISLKGILTNHRYYSLRESALNSLEQTMENFRSRGYILTDLVDPSELSYSTTYNKWVISKIKFHKENLFSNWSEVERAIPEKYQERLSRSKFNSPALSCLSKYRKL